MEYTKLQGSWLNGAAMAQASDLAVATWVRLLTWCMNARAPGVVAGCSGWSDQLCLRTLRCTRAELDEVVGHELASWDGDNLLLNGFDAHGLSAMLVRESQFHHGSKGGEHGHLGAVHGAKGGRPKKTPPMGGIDGGDTNNPPTATPPQPIQPTNPTMHSQARAREGVTQEGWEAEAGAWLPALRSAGVKVGKGNWRHAAELVKRYGVELLAEAAAMVPAPERFVDALEAAAAGLHRQHLDAEKRARDASRQRLRAEMVVALAREPLAAARKILASLEAEPLKLDHRAEVIVGMLRKGVATSEAIRRLLEEEPRILTRLSPPAAAAGAA